MIIYFTMSTCKLKGWKPEPFYKFFNILQALVCISSKTHTALKWSNN